MSGFRTDRPGQPSSGDADSQSATPLVTPGERPSRVSHQGHRTRPEGRRGEGAVEKPDLAIRFWGVRGSIACPGADTARYGGNTSCVELRYGERVVIFDAG